MTRLSDIIEFLEPDKSTYSQDDVVFPASINSLKNNALIFIENIKYASNELLEQIDKNSVIIVREDLYFKLYSMGFQLILSKNPKLDFIRVLGRFYTKNESNHYKKVDNSFVDNNALLHSTVMLGINNIVDNCEIGENSELKNNVHVYNNVKIGKNVVIHDNCTIGSPGFGFVSDDEGKMVKFPHIGGVIIEDNVEIFPLSNVDRGALGNTIIDKGVKIDHCCHIGHNSIIGQDTIITANTIIGGSTKVGRNVFIGPNSAIIDRITIGDRVLVGIGSVVRKNTENGVVVAGNPAKYLRDNT